MSVLRIPRLFFKGQTSWNPATLNNNDQWPTVDVARSEMNWEFLGDQHPPITPANAGATFPVWARTLQYFGPRGAVCGWYQPPAEWNYYGGNEAALHTATSQTEVTGAQFNYGGPVQTDDDLVGKYVDLVGDPYPGTTFPTAARLTDVNPDSFWSTCFFLRRVQIGDESGPASCLDGEVAPGTFMSSVWMNLQRNLNTDGGLEIAGVGGAVLQACLPKGATLHMADSSSQWMQGVRRELGRREVRGLMVRLSVYMTRYFSAEEFSGCRGLTAKYTRLAQLWDEDLRHGRVPTQNPAVSTVVGSIGLWMNGELASVPGGRFLPPVARVPAQIPSADPRPTALGPTVVEVHRDEGFVSLDLGATIPELDSSGRKSDVGLLTLVLVESNGCSTTLGTLGREGYDQQMYEATAGIVDLPVPAAVDRQRLQGGTLRLLTGDASTIALEEATITVQTDRRGVWVDQGEAVTLPIQVRQNGAVPTETVHVRLVQYLPHPPPPAPDPGAWARPSAPDPGVLAFTNAPCDVVTVEPDGTGCAEVSFTALTPGFATIVFLPHRDGSPPPVEPPERIYPGISERSTSPCTMMSAFYCSVRVMPFDDKLPGAFAHVWNSTNEGPVAWAFVYREVLALYQLLYPAMKHYASLDLGDKEAVDRNIKRIVRLTSHEPHDSTVRMPVTRDLSAGKRAVLEMYGQLVASNWEGDLEVPPGFPAPDGAVQS